MEMVNIKINGTPISVQKGISILEAARVAGIEIPTLCFLKKINEIGACRICMVEVKGARSLVTACVYPVNEGMEIFTNTAKVRRSRKLTLELILSTHDKRCLSCVRSGNCELQHLCKEFGVDDEDYFKGENPQYAFDDSVAHMIRNNNKCILCRRCVAACEAQKVAVIGANARGFDTHISSAFDKDLADVSCISCGQCIVNCPTAALVEKDDTGLALAAINDPSKFVIVNTAPSIRVTLGESFGMHIGTNVQGKMVAALRRLGFDKVFDTDIGADLTIVEEANEFIDRVKNGGVLPMITSCSPGWVKYCEHYYPDQISHLSTCKSPQQMFGALAKTYYAQKRKLNPKDIVSVSIMPCTAKKFEANRPEMRSSGYKDVDFVLTTRELGIMIKQAGLDFEALPEEKYDSFMGSSTGAAVIFGSTGGVMEAALRTAYEVVTGRPVPFDGLNIVPVRGTEGEVREATIKIENVKPEWSFLEGVELKCAVANGLAHAKTLMQNVKDGKANYHFIEVMACPGGCLGGGGQPIPTNKEIRSKRKAAIYEEDMGMPTRKSHDNPEVLQLYQEFLEKPLGHKSHELLHTYYTPRKRY